MGVTVARFSIQNAALNAAVDTVQFTTNAMFYELLSNPVDRGSSGDPVLETFLCSKWQALAWVRAFLLRRVLSPYNAATAIGAPL